jgi:hypothetical protein
MAADGQPLAARGQIRLAADNIPGSGRAHQLSTSG